MTAEEIARLRERLAHVEFTPDARFPDAQDDITALWDALHALLALAESAQSACQNAARYRWLRDLPEGSPHEQIGNFPGCDWDDAIDSAMQTHQPPSSEGEE